MPARKPEECDTLLGEALNRGDLEAAVALYEADAAFDYSPVEERERGLVDAAVAGGDD